MCRFLDRINMIYRIGHQAGKAGGKVLEKRAGGGRNVRFELITLTPNL